jgi:hypothetical protein
VLIVVVYIPSLTLVGMIGTNSSSIRGDIYWPILVTSLSICSLHVITSPHLMARYPHHLTHILTSVLSISPSNTTTSRYTLHIECMY